jgi:hypothetical protein
VSFQTEKKSHMCLVQRMYIDTQVKYWKQSPGDKASFHFHKEGRGD